VLKKLLKKDEGFTLIEVVLVLAIAGLILVIVFLAVQGAQRGRRDTERKNAAARLLAAAEQVASNTAGGVLPANCAAIGTAYNNSGGNYPCSDASNTGNNIQYEDGVDCAGTSNARFARARATMETGGVVYCEDNN
jgi:prepilin-type N-terminal cleavage/methylation domain-containing protein